MTTMYLYLFAYYLDLHVSMYSFCTLIYVKLENYQALLWWLFQMGKFLREKATLIKSEILK